MIFEVQDNRAVMQYYAAIAQQSEDMLRAAEAGDWAMLCEAEGKVSLLIQELQDLKRNQARLNEAERQQHIGYLKKILADDAAIRNITEPRLRQLEEFLRAASNNQRLNNTYGT